MYDAANRADGPIVSADNAMVAARRPEQHAAGFFLQPKTFSWLTFQDHYHCRLGRTWPHAAAAVNAYIRIKSLFDESDVGNDTYDEERDAPALRKLRLRNGRGLR